MKQVAIDININYSLTSVTEMRTKYSSVGYVYKFMSIC